MLDKMKMLSRIKELYAQDKNIIHYLKDEYGQKGNTIEDIMIGYDFQAGTYSARYEEKPEYYNRFVSRLAKTIDGLSCKKKSIMECGAGEANILATLLAQMSTSPETLWGG